MTSRWRRLTPVLVAGVTVALSAVTAALAARHAGFPASFVDGNTATTWLAGLAFGVIGAAVVRDAPGNLLGPVMSVAGILAAANATATEVALLDTCPLGAVAAWFASVLWLPAFLGLVLLLPLLYPFGRLASRRWRWPARLACASLGAATVLVATTQDVVDSSGFAWAHNALDLPFPDGPQLAVAAILATVCVTVAVAAAIGVVLRMRRAEPEDRARYAWFTVALLCGLVTVGPLPTLASLLLNVASFAALGIGIVRHQLFDVEPVLSRTLVYVVLLAAAMAVYVAAAALLGVGLGSGAAPAIVTAVAALLLASLQGRVHRALRRLLYGDRDDPAALTRIGDRLAATIGTDDVLPASVEAVRRTLRVPYADITFSGEGAPAYASGQTDGRVVDVPLQHAGVDIASLRVGLRSGERQLTGRDAALLRRFAPQVAVAVHDIRATRALRRSREQVVTLRERERHRIHRDLHDGLGPALAGISLGLETASRLVVRDGPAAAALIDALRDDATSCVDDVRRIVADLRPPALDEVGLVGALQRRVDLVTASTDGRVEVTVQAELCETLPEAVEVAAFLIAGEALTNAVRHARAGQVRIVVRAGDSLEVLIEDDGCGTEPARLGTGLRSMRQRAEELGGTCGVRFRPGTGTVVHARLPLALVRTS